MRVIRHISPSGLAKWKSDPESYYTRYLATTELGEEPQTQPMSIGSAFDAYAKNYIYEGLFGKNHDPKYSLEALFESQVQPHWWEWAWKHGQYVFDIYKRTGCLSDMMLELQQAVNVPKFEIEVKGVINGSKEAMTLAAGGMILLGKPDVFYINAHGAHVIVDFKVNGYCSKSSVSPKPGYVRIRNDRKKTGAHDKCVLGFEHGMMINTDAHLEDIDKQWATQLSIYAWLLGVEIGEDFIAGIDQICCGPSGGEFPDIRIAEHRLRVSKPYQQQVFNDAATLWNIAHSNHFFREMTLEDSIARCQVLDDLAKNIAAEEDPVFLEMTRPQPGFYKAK